MGPGTDRAIPLRDADSVPARAPNIDPRAKAGAFGEAVRGPHKPTLDEMGPHAMLPAKGAPASDAHHRRPHRSREKRPPRPPPQNRQAGAVGAARLLTARRTLQSVAQRQDSLPTDGAS